tara:strand:+ start:12152 stop:13372 length:1221 start_codon:yes stop_codon:yes gene_type:complete
LKKSLPTKFELFKEANINPTFLPSGLNGQALEISMNDIPSRREVRASIPSHCFSRQTNRSLFYLFRTLSIQFFVVWIGLLIPLNMEMIPLWVIYAIFSGTTSMGLWVLAHECGHGAFSNNRRLETFVGYCLHSFLLVPYFSWQRSHAVHHAFTNHITAGETHVPVVISGDGKSEKVGGENEMESSLLLGKTLYGFIQLFLHLILGWPAYLLSGKTGGPRYGTSNHFWPIAPFSKKLWPSIWAKKVWFSDFGIIFMFILLGLWSIHFGIYSMISLYLGPLIVVNIWLVVYTWLHHTDTDVPHLGANEFSYMRGAFLSIDRPYGRVLDFLHHSIGSTHAIHHIEPTIPHYHARLATRILREKFPKVYLYNPTPILKSLWHIATNCVAVRKDYDVDRYVWKQPSYSNND